jgi:hypothetical protein
MAGSLKIVDSGHGDSTEMGAERFEAIRRQSRALRQKSQEARARAQTTCDQIERGRPRREVLRDSAFARLHAQMGTMQEIEQAKGIIMAQQRCGPDEAFDLLRRMSQSTNIKLHALAAQLVASSSGDNVTPISLGSRRHLRPGRL